MCSEVGKRLAEVLSKIPCRSCGTPLKQFVEFGKDKICPYCGKISAPVNTRELHVTFSSLRRSDIDHELWDREGEFEVGIDYEHITLEYILDIGDISDPPYSNAYSYAHSYTSADVYKQRVANELDRLADIPNSAEVFFWYNYNDANSYLNMLYFSKFFLRFDKVYSVCIHTDEDVANASYKISDSLERKRILSKDEIRLMWEKFKSASCESRAIRMLNDESIVVLPEDYFDEYVLKHFDTEYKSFSKIVFKTHDEIKSEFGYYLSWHMCKEIMYALASKGKIRSRGLFGWWGDDSFGFMICERDFRVAYKRKPAYTETDLWNILKLAFEYGATHILYGAMTENAQLLIEPEDKGVSGRREIIDYIEIRGSETVHVKKQSLTASDIATVSVSNRYEIGQKCLILFVDEQKYVVTSEFLGGKINKINVSKMELPLAVTFEDDSEW